MITTGANPHQFKDKESENVIVTMANTAYSTITYVAEDVIGSTMEGLKNEYCAQTREKQKTQENGGK